MRRRTLALSIGAALAVTVTIASAAPNFGLELLPAHTATAPRARLDATFARAVDAEIARAEIGSTDDALQLALRVTGEHLHFGLGHSTRLVFDGQEREANCIEYAHLFATVFRSAATRSGIGATAYVVHSAHARVYGMRVPLNGFGDHDWVFVVDRDGRRFYVDPTLFDAGLGWDVSGSVRGQVAVAMPPARKR